LSGWVFEAGGVDRRGVLLASGRGVLVRVVVVERSGFGRTFGLHRSQRLSSSPWMHSVTIRLYVGTAIRVEAMWSRCLPGEAWPRRENENRVVAMTPDDLRDFCLSLPQAIETYPFGEVTAVYKTSGNGKIFALSALDHDPLVVTVKCDPEDGIALRSEFSQITEGYHLNKRYWITIVVGTGVPDELVEQLVSESHALVRPRIPRGSH
jgi:predicted DNA-binding protein (MmcQ/YjbR family)